MSKQDGYSSRTAADLERKYNFGKTFAEVYNLISDAQRAAQEAKNAFDGLSHKQIFNLLTNYGEWQGIYRDDNGDVYVNASFIKGGTIKGDYVQVEAATITGQLVATQIDTKDLKVLAANITGQLTAGQIDATNLNVSAANVTGTLTASQIAANAITWAKLATAVQNDINDAYAMAEDAEAAAADAADTVDGWRYNGGTYIDGSMIMAGTVIAGSLIGGEVGLLTSAERQAGGMDITGSSSSSYAIELWSNGALRLMAYNGSAYLGSDDGASIEVSERVWINNHMYPSDSDAYNCGNANYPWAMVYSTNGMCETSDRKKKKDIEYGLDSMDGFFDDLQPSLYRMVKGTSGRKHCGFVAQDIKANLDKHGISTKDFGGYVADKDENGNETFGLRYSEFIPLIVEQVQKLKARVAELEGKKHGQKA